MDRFRGLVRSRRRLTGANVTWHAAHAVALVEQGAWRLSTQWSDVVSPLALRRARRAAWRCPPPSSPLPRYSLRSPLVVESFGVRDPLPSSGKASVGPPAFKAGGGVNHQQPCSLRRSKRSVWEWRLHQPFQNEGFSLNPKDCRPTDYFWSTPKVQLGGSLAGNDWYDASSTMSHASLGLTISGVATADGASLSRFSERSRRRR